MDPHTNKRRPRALMDAKKRSGASFIDGDDKAQFCTRIGCSGRIKYAQSSKIQSNFHTSDSSNTSRMMTAAKSSPDSRRKLASQLKYAHSNSSLSTDSEDASSTSSPSESQGESQQAGVTKRRISVASLARPRKPFPPTASSMNRSPSLVSSTPSFSRSSDSSTPATRSLDLPLSNSSGGARLGRRNLKYSSASDSRGSYSSPGSQSFSKNSKKKNAFDAERNSSRFGGKAAAAASTDTRCLPSSSTLTSVRNKGNSAACQGGSSSSSSRGKMPVSTNTSTRMRPPTQNEGSHSYAVTPTTSTGIPGNARVVGQRSVSAGNPRSCSLPRGCRDRQPTNMPPSRALGAVRFTPSTNRDCFHHYDFNGAAEMMLALESEFEQDEDMSPEQMLLEMSLFLGRLTLFDQHQDMRLDIDNMSYEELLALEERMGSVSTPLSDEELSRCLKRSVYQQASGSSGDDTKCSICQEDYVMGDMIGVLSRCCHQYHETCISQWLRLKNWCPICKASAAT